MLQKQCQSLSYWRYYNKYVICSICYRERFALEMKI